MPLSLRALLKELDWALTLKSDENGAGVAQDYATALHWYELAASQNYVTAEYALGRLYEAGHGVPQDYATALHRYQLAAAQGDPASAIAVQRIEQLLLQTPRP